jgi:enamine deaminase RidA (YjgF/YER057c/UK114 family)
MTADGSALELVQGEGGMAEITKLKSNSTIEGRNNYGRAVGIDDWILLANTAGRNFSTREMPADAAGQAEQMFRNVEGALSAMGSGLADVVRARVSVPDPADMPAVMAVFARKFAGVDPVGTFTCTPLAGPEYKVEIEITAYRGAGGMAVRRLTVVL